MATTNKTLQNLLNQYTSKMTYDPRTFSTDVLSQDQFAEPFNAWTQNAINTYLLPEFLRYQYDPQMEAAKNQLYGANQQMGTSGAWRTEQGTRDLDAAAQEAMRQQEQLGTQFNDQAMQTQQAFQEAWSDPLYKQRMEAFYNAPWADVKLGTPQPSVTGDIPGLNFSSIPTQQFGQTTPFSGNNNSLYSQYMGANPLGNRMQQNNNIFSSYMKNPSLANQYQQDNSVYTNTPGAYKVM